MRVLSTNKRQSAIYAVWLYVSHPKRIQPVACFEKKLADGWADKFNYKFLRKYTVN
jgi:hypothetical protein